MKQLLPKQLPYQTCQNQHHVFNLYSPTELTSFNVHINNVLLQGMTCVKYLGMLIDSRLDWSSHVQLIKRKLLYAY